jgi:hypothetical protein
MAKRYAEGTSVSVEASQSEAITILKRYGAKGYMFGQSPDGAGFVAFVFRDLPVRVTVPKPVAKPYSGSGPRIDVNFQIEAEKRRQWRVLILWLKGQLEAIDNELLSPYRGFMPFLQLKDGRTMGEAAEEEPALLGKLGSGLALPAPKG